MEIEEIRKIANEMADVLEGKKLTNEEFAMVCIIFNTAATKYLEKQLGE